MIDNALVRMAVRQRPFIGRARLVPWLVATHYRLLRRTGARRWPAIAAALRWARLLAA